MEEALIWKGSPSQWTNFGLFVSCILILPIPFAFWQYLKTKNRVFTITDERIIETTGVFSKSTDELELYRVKDLKWEQPFFLRLVEPLQHPDEYFRQDPCGSADPRHCQWA